MRILLVNSVCGQGSTGKITLDLYSEYTRLGHDARICYGRGPKREDGNLIKIARDWEVYLHGISTRLTGWVGKGSPFATSRLMRQIEAFSPDIVHLHNIHGYYVDAYRLLSYLKKRGINTVITMHDEWLFTGKCGHPYGCGKWLGSCRDCPQLREYPKSIFFDRSESEFALKSEAFKRFDNLVFAPVSDWLRGQAAQSPYLSGKRFQVVYNGIDTGVFYPRETDGLRQKHGLAEEKVIVHVTPNFSDTRKGGAFVVELARRLSGENIRIIVIGVSEPIEDCPGNLTAVSRTGNQADLAAYYSLGDIFLITSEMECLPTVCLEALCCGTPVVGFDTGGTGETAPPPLGCFVPYGDMERLERIVREIITGETPMAGPEQCARFGREHYDKKKMAETYLLLYEELDRTAR